MLHVSQTGTIVSKNLALVRARMKHTFPALAVRVKKMYAQIDREMPTLSGNLRAALILELDQSKMRTSIRLRATGPYGTTDYFPCWGRTHKSIAQHTADEIAHAKARGAMGIQANPMAISGGTSDIQKDPFVKALSDEGMTNIKVIESGPKGKRRTYTAAPPFGWPFIR